MTATQSAPSVTQTHLAMLKSQHAQVLVALSMSHLLLELFLLSEIGGPIEAMTQIVPSFF